MNKMDVMSKVSDILEAKKLLSANQSWLLRWEDALNASKQGLVEAWTEACWDELSDDLDDLMLINDELYNTIGIVTPDDEEHSYYEGIGLKPVADGFIIIPDDVFEAISKIIYDWAKAEIISENSDIADKWNQNMREHCDHDIPPLIDMNAALVQIK